MWNSFWSPSAHFLETKKQKFIFAHRPKKGSPTIISVVFPSRMEVSSLLRVRLILLRPVQAFFALELRFSGLPFLKKAKVLKKRLQYRSPSEYCKDTIVSFLLRLLFGPLRQSWLATPCSLFSSFCGFLAFVRYYATKVWLKFTPCFLLVLHTAAKLFFYGLVHFHYLRWILADDFKLHLEVSRSSVGRNGYPDCFYSVKSFVAADLALLPRFHFFTLIVYGFSVPYYGL